MLRFQEPVPLLLSTYYLCTIDVECARTCVIKRYKQRRRGLFAAHTRWYKFCAVHSSSIDYLLTAAASVAQPIRHSPYTIPAPRPNTMSSFTTYNPQHFSSEAASVPIGAGAQTSAMLPGLSSSGNARPPSPSDGLSHVNNQLRICYSSDSSGNASSDSNSPCSSNSPNSPPDFSVEEASLFADPYNIQCCQAGYYSSAPSHLNKHPGSGSMANGDPMASPQAFSQRPMPAYPSAVAPSSMLQPPGVPYSYQDYYFSNFSNTRFMPPTFTCAAPSYFSNTSPSFTSHMPSLNMHMWR